MSRPAPFQLRGVPAWDALVATVERAFAEATWPEAGRDVRAAVRLRESQRTLRVRVRFTRKREPQASEEFCVLFLEDVRNVQARSRQEKLAAMGRVSAGIAHEIRNPLAAIAQANALLVRGRHRPGAAPADADGHRQRRAAEAHRRRRDGGRAGQAQEVGAIDATAQVAAVCGEWARARRHRSSASAACCGVELPAEPLGVAVRRRAPAPRARQPARQRAPPRQRAARRDRAAARCGADERRACRLQRR